MAQALGRIKETILDSSGEPVVGVNLELRRQGATVNSDQSGASPFTVAVHDLGGIIAGDVVSVGIGTTQLSVSSISIANKTLTISGFVGTLSLDDGSRITPVGSLPVVYLDVALANSGTNPMVTDSKGDALSNAADVAYAPYGYYDYLLSGTDQDGNTITTELVEDFFVPAISPIQDGSSARHGIRIDNLTDDGQSLNNAILDRGRTVTSDLRGGILELPSGNLITNVPILNEHRVIIMGNGARNTRIVAGPSFPTSTPIVTLGTAGSDVYACRLERLNVDANSVAGSIGVKCFRLQEDSGLRDVVVARAVDTCVQTVSASICQQSVFKDLQLSPLGAAAIGFDAQGCVNVDLDHVTVNSYDGVTVSTAPGIRIAGGYVRVWKAHLEHSAIGVQLLSGGSMELVGITGHASCAVLIQLEATAAGFTGLGLNGNGSPTIINDLRSGGAGAITVMNASGFYFHTNDGSAPNKTMMGSPSAIPWRINSKTTVLGAFSFGPRADLTTATSVTLPTAGNYFRLTGATTPIDNISARDAGSVIILESEAAAATNITIRDISGSGGNIYLAGSTSLVLTAGDKDTLTLLCDGTNWIQIANSNN